MESALKFTSMELNYFFMLLVVSSSFVFKILSVELVLIQTEKCVIVVSFTTVGDWT